MQDLNCNFDIVKKTSTTGIIVDNMIELITERSLKPGDKLPPERELAMIMHVSRPSLREALKALQIMNIIDIRQGSGAFIKGLKPESIVEHLDIVFTLDNSLYHDLYAARRVLETAIAKMAAEAITEEELLEIEANIIRGANALDNPNEFLKLDYELHTMILKASKNRILPVFIQSINKLNLLMREKTNSYLEIREKTIVDHQKILDALKRRDPLRASLAMEEHLTHVEVGFDNASVDEGVTK